MAHSIIQHNYYNVEYSILHVHVQARVCTCIYCSLIHHLLVMKRDVLAGKHVHVLYMYVIIEALFNIHVRTCACGYGKHVPLCDRVMDIST